MKRIKKLMCFIISGSMMISLYSCSGSVNDNKDDDSEASSKILFSAPLADESYDKKDGMPPVCDELMELYEKAVVFSQDISFDNIEYAVNDEGDIISVEDGGNVWNMVNDQRFGTYAEMEAYVSDIFTEERAKEEMASLGNCFKDINGSLYSIGGARGSNIAYVGHYFTIDSVSDDSVLLTAHIYNSNSDEPLNGDIVYEKQQDESNYTVETVTIEFVKENGQWKLNQFKLLY